MRYVQARLILEVTGPVACTVVLADGVIDWEGVTGPDHALVIPCLPAELRHVAESLESAMTTGCEFPE